VKRSLAALAVSASLVLTLAACGSQTDERVASESPTAESSTPEASASVEESSPAATETPSSVQSSIAAATPFVTVDCTSGQVSPTDSPPSNGTTIGSVTGSLQATGAPAITIATDATPATELGVADMVKGTGATAAAGDNLTVNYCGVGLGGKTLFDSSYTRGQPATFPLSGVIPGWQEGVPGMKVGGTRLLVIPGAMAYGATPPGGSGIAPDETLVFVVTLESIG
jgi:peptidylprolyl isomerase